MAVYEGIERPGSGYPAWHNLGQAANLAYKARSIKVDEDTTPEAAETKPDAEPSPAARFVLAGACLAWAAVVLLGMWGLLGTNGLPEKMAKNARESPWMYVCFLLLGVAFAYVGMHGVLKKHAFNTGRAGNFAPDEFRGTSAVLVGAVQCFTGASVVGACLYVLLFGI
jgi:hypothetical protein